MRRRLDTRVLGWMSRALSHELAAAQQYAAQSALAQLWGDEALAEALWREAVKELEHARRLFRLVLERGHTVISAGSIAAPRLGADRQELVAANIALERRAVQLYELAHAEAVRWQDPQAASLFAELLDEEIAHEHALQQRQEQGAGDG